MTAPAGAEVGIYIDLQTSVEVGDVIETTSGRRYIVASVRVQKNGKHAGRQHLRVIVMAPGDPLPSSGTLHPIRWYPRSKR